MIAVGIVDDKMVNRKTVARSLQAAGGFHIALEASNGKEFLEKMDALDDPLRPQVVLMDIDMPVMDGIGAIAVGNIRFPQTRFLVLTVFDDDEKIFEAIQAGASGYLLKDDSAIQLAEVIQQTLEFNGAPMSPAIARKTLSWLKGLPKSSITTTEEDRFVLSQRELEIVRLMVQGHDYRSIAATLFISPNTVRSHISKIYEKLHIHSKAQAVQLAYKYKWIT